MPGMKYAVLSRCPTIGGKVSAFDDKESKKISGVSYVGKISDSAVGDRCRQRMGRNGRAPPA